MNYHQWDRYGFLWSEARLVIAALALFLGGVPPALRFFGWFPLVGALLLICWVVSGLVSAYLLYRWFEHNWHLFGAKRPLDMAVFAVNIVSGLNLGIAGLIGRNIGMSISSNYTVFVIVALVYLASAAQLYIRWNSNGEKLF